MPATATLPPDKSPPAAVVDAPMFRHKQTVNIKARRLGAMPDGRKVFVDDWTERGMVRATKRDLRPMGYWVVQFADGGQLCVHQERLRAA